MCRVHSLSNISWSPVKVPPPWKTYLEIIHLPACQSKLRMRKKKKEKRKSAAFSLFGLSHRKNRLNAKAPPVVTHLHVSVRNSLSTFGAVP